MRELVEYIVKQLVNNPDDVVVEETSQEGQVELLLTVNGEDMGIVIGKGGQTIKALRKVLTVRAMADNVRVNLRLNEVGGKPEVTEIPENQEEETEKSESSISKTEETPKETPQESEPAS